MRTYRGAKASSLTLAVLIAKGKQLIKPSSGSLGMTYQNSQYIEKASTTQLDLLPSISLVENSVTTNHYSTSSMASREPLPLLENFIFLVIFINQLDPNGSTCKQREVHHLKYILERSGDCSPIVVKVSPLYPPMRSRLLSLHAGEKESNSWIEW